MKAIKVQIIINSVRSRKDKSISFSAETPELTNEERNIFFDLQGTTAEALIEPEEGTKDEEVTTVNKEVNYKSPSERLRAVLYLLHIQKGGTNENWNLEYPKIMEKIIDHYKAQLES